MPAGGFLPPVIAELRADISGFSAKMAEAGVEMDAVSKKGGSSFDALATGGKYALLALGGAAVAAGALSVHMAGDFQASMTQLVTDAGESTSNLKMVGNGILNMAGQVGDSANDLAVAMKQIDSVGIHGAQSLVVLREAAEGAKVGNANLTDTTHALVSVLSAYHQPASQATSDMNVLIATVEHGNVRLEDLSTAMQAITPEAAALHVPLSSVGAAMATMTSQGTDANRASQYLRFTLSALINPTAKAKKALDDIGLSATDLGQTLTSKGIYAAMQQLSVALAQRFPGDAAVANAAFARVKAGTENMDDAITDITKTTSPQFVAAMSNITGGTRGMQAALELTGANLPTLAANFAATSKVAGEGGKNIHDWSQIQANFNQQIKQVESALGALAIRIGEKLIPVVQHVAHDVMEAVHWFGKHRDVALALGAAIGSVLVVAIGIYIGEMAAAAVATIAATWPLLLIVAAVAAVAAGVVYCYEHFKTFHRIVDDVGRFLKAHFVEILKEVGAFLLGGPIGAGLLYLYDHFKVFRDGVRDAIHGVAAVISWMFHNVWQPEWHAMVMVIEAAWRSIIKPYFEDIAHVITGVIVPAVEWFVNLWVAEFHIAAAVVMWLWNTILHPWVDAIEWMFRTIIVPAVKFLWQVWTDEFHAIGDVLSWVWHSVIEPTFHLLTNTLNDAKKVIHDLQVAWDVAWSAVKHAVSDAWNVVKPIFDAIKSGIKDLTGGLGGLGHALGSIGHAGGSVLSTLSGGLLASGTDFAPGGLTLVGEEGPEIVNMPRGAQVIPAGQTAAILASSSRQLGTATGAAGATVINVEVNVAGQVVTAQQLVQFVRDELIRQGRRNGGGVLAGLA